MLLYLDSTTKQNFSPNLRTRQISDTCKFLLGTWQDHQGWGGNAVRSPVTIQSSLLKPSKHSKITLEMLPRHYIITQIIFHTDNF